MPKYDLAVVGAGLGGLAAAALVARQGGKTVVIEPGDSVGGVLAVYKKGGCVFSPGPHLSFGFERDGTIQMISEKLGIALNASLYSPCYQVALPDRRITVYAEHSETLEELRREFSQEIDHIAKFYRDIRSVAMKSEKSRITAFLSKRRNAGRFIRRYRFSREFTAFLDVQSLVFFRRRIADLSLRSLIMLCDTPPFAVHDGFVKVAMQMVDVILKNKGEIHYNVPLSEIVLHEGRAAGITIPQASLDADAVLLNTDQKEPGDVMFIGIRDNVLPVGMLHNVLCLADFSRPEDLFTLSISAKDDENAAPRGMSSLAASFSFLPIRRTNDELMHNIDMVMPFLNDFVVQSERHKPSPRVYSLPEGTSFKPIRLADSPVQLNRSSIGRVYLLGDGSGTPVQEIAAAQALVERLK